MDMKHLHALDTREHKRELRLVRVTSIYGTRFLGIHEVEFIDGKLEHVSKAVPYFCGDYIHELELKSKEIVNAFSKPVIDDQTKKEIPANELNDILGKDRLEEKDRQERSLTA